ncbi:MAG: gamma-glutamyl-gamma-aminobutyrate hydrolase family protein, partial [Oscillospiraceae bacterium]|nr:gamma-glutamyl-gamma-aminobutyrate hydrolase family protein [Oscillospiraceae bacterium]
IVPGGFGDRGIEGMIEAIRYARVNKKPMFGICLGMQMSVIEYARNVLGLSGANSTEFGETPYPVIDIMEDQKTVTEKGGTMRLGLYPCKLTEGSICRRVYGDELIYERHRHRWEFNNAFRSQLTENGLRIAGISPDERLVEIVEVPDHPWFVGVQFHPEFKSRPNKPHKLFADFIRASLENSGK